MAPSSPFRSSVLPEATRRDALLRVARAAFGMLPWPGLRLAQASAISDEAFPPAGGATSPRLRFALPLLDEALASRMVWEPLLNSLCAVAGCVLETATLISLESLARAVTNGEVDAGFLPAEALLHAVVDGRMRILAQPRRLGDEAPNRAVLLVRKTAPPDALERLMAQPQHWRIARGEPPSIPGYVVPQARLFLPHGIDMETAFQGEIVGSTVITSLALANGDVDLATGTLKDHRLFCQHFPTEGQRLRIIWRSEPLPAERFAIRSDWPAQSCRQVEDFLLGYGGKPGLGGAQERAVLHALNTPGGYEAANKASLLPAAQLLRDLSLQRVQAGRWTSDAARERRLARIATEYVRQRMALLRDEEHSGADQDAR